MPKVLVTGAAGFIGRHLTRHLFELGYGVRALVRTDGAYHCTSERLERVIVADLVTLGVDDWLSHLRGVDAVVHLAALAHRTDQTHQPTHADFMSANATVTDRLAEAMARGAGPRRLVFLSSVGACRSSSDDVLTAATICTPDTDYSKSKLEAERHVRRHLDRGNVDYCILRPPVVYGPGNPGNMGRLLALIRTGLPLPLGAIRNRRSLAYVGNVVHAIERCLTAGAASRQTFFVADPGTLSTPEMLAALASATTGRRCVVLPAPIWALTALGRLGGCAETLLRRDIGINLYSVTRLRDSLFVDIEPLIEAIGSLPYESRTAIALSFATHAAEPPQ